MLDDVKKGSFDKLVAGLSSEDRVNMLDRINKNSAPSVQFIETENDVPEKNMSLHLRYKNESILYKIMLWFRGLISKKSAEKLYNEDVLANIARKINRDHPGIINHRIQVLDSVFYQLLRSLKDSADFFKPYFTFIDDNPGDFYVFLSSFVTPELSEQINSQADPFTLSFDVEPTNEVRAGLLRKLDDILKGIDGQAKSSMYYSVCSVNWLRQFTKLPYIHFTSQFTNLTGDVYTTPYKNAINDFDAFSAVFSNIHPVQNEVLEAMLLFSQRKELTKNAQEKDIERTIKEFLAKANQHFANIQMFISTVPINRVGKIINEDYDWVPGNINGVEAWFPSFRSQWRKIFDVRWNDWLRERKKNTLSETLNADFKLTDFPSMKYRPWMALWSRVPFACELTGGFLSWFSEELYDDVLPTLNEVMMEGVFIRNENRIEYSEGLNLFVQANTQMIELQDRLSPEGEYGALFDEFASSRIRSFQVQNQIDSMMATTESEVKDILKKFCKGCRMMDRIFHGMFDEGKDGEHETLQNFTTIKGHQNRAWRDRLAEIRTMLQRSLFYISELEPIDAATTNE